MIRIVLNCRFYETDFAALTYDALLTLQHMHHQNSVLSNAYVFDSLRCGDDPEYLFRGYQPARHKSVREYGKEGLDSLVVYDGFRQIERHNEDVKQISIDDYGDVVLNDVIRYSGKNYIIGCRVFYDFTSFQADLHTDSFDYEKLKLLYSDGIDEKKFGGTISIDPSFILYDDDCYSTQIGVYDLTTRILRIRYMGIVLDNHGRVLFSSIDDTLESLLNNMVRE